MNTKYIIIISLMLLLTLGFYVVVKELTYSPLTEKDFNKLFLNYNSAKKKCSVDFIGLSLHGELFDIFKYELNNVIVDSLYPIIKDSWSNISGEYIVTKWKKIPMDSTAYSRCEDIIDLGNYSEQKCSSSFASELSNPMNYYCYIYVNELEYYFCLYCPRKHYLYYVRKKGW